MSEEQRVPENCPACGVHVGHAQFAVTDNGILQVCAKCAHPLAKAPVLGDVNMFRNPQQNDSPAQLSLPIAHQDTVEGVALGTRRRSNVVPRPAAPSSQAPRKHRSLMAEMKTELRELDQEIKRLEKLKTQRAELARMLDAAKDIAAEKKQQAKPLRAIA